MAITDPNARFYVTTRIRPRRIAFLLDLSSPETDDYLDAIVDFNIDAWGGRYNPIVETANGELSPAEWGFLKIIDPDVVYVFGQLTDETAQRIAKWIQPIKLKSHEQYREGSNNGPRACSRFF